MEGPVGSEQHSVGESHQGEGKWRGRLERSENESEQTGEIMQSLAAGEVDPSVNCQVTSLLELYELNL